MLPPLSKPFAAVQLVPKLNSDNVQKFESVQTLGPKFSPKPVPRQVEDENEVVYMVPPAGIKPGELVEFSKQTKQNRQANKNSHTSSTYFL